MRDKKATFFQVDRALAWECYQPAPVPEIPVEHNHGGTGPAPLASDAPIEYVLDVLLADRESLEADALTDRMLAAYRDDMADEDLACTLIERWKSTPPSILMMAEYLAGIHPFGDIFCRCIEKDHERWSAQLPVARLLARHIEELRATAINIVTGALREAGRDDAATDPAELLAILDQHDLPLSTLVSYVRLHPHGNPLTVEDFARHCWEFYNDPAKLNCDGSSSEIGLCSQCHTYPTRRVGVFLVCESGQCAPVVS